MNEKKYPWRKELKGSDKTDGIDLVGKVLSFIKKFRDYEKPGAKLIYRGVSHDYTYDEDKNLSYIRSGAAIRLDGNQMWNYSYSTYMAYVRGLITDVKRNYPENYSNWNDLEILGDLQHNGAGTCLVDFSRNMLISLWFACGETREKGPGKLYCYNVYDDLIRRNNLKVIKETDLNKPIEKLLVETKHTTNYCSNTEYSFFMWTPSNLNNRIARQDSVFIFGLPIFDISEHSILEITIPYVLKSKIRETLEFYFDVNDTSIFNDKHGFAKVNDKLTPYPTVKDMYEQGIVEMIKGNYKTALDFFIMKENHMDSTNNSEQAEILINNAELHLSKAICYKYINQNYDEDKDKYANNAIREYTKARKKYCKAIFDYKSNKEFKYLYARKLLRTINEEIHLLYTIKEYERCIKSCDIAIDIIKQLRKKKISDVSRDGSSQVFKSVYCDLSKLELLLLIVLQEKEESEHIEVSDSNKNRWKRFHKTALKRKTKNEMSEFDGMLLDYFELIWEVIINNSERNKNDDTIVNIKNKEDDIDNTFISNLGTTDNVSYSSWDFTEIKEALSKSKIDESEKTLLIELTAHMISIRDRYNVKELNTPVKNEVSGNA